MNTKLSTNRKLKRMFANILSIFAILAIAFPATGNVSAQEPALPEGYHDGMDGTVNAAGCTAFGWAVDPEDRNRDLQVRILADENPVATTTADLLREDVGACTGGTCGFGVNLWGLVSAGVEHLISAQAYDVETDTWVDLSGTPKTLTCWGYPEGFHDYDSGDVPSWACNAGGWAMDPDDPERNLTVRILADGTEVTSTTAENEREDLRGICGEDGSCGFEVSLWDLVTPYEDHQITAQAYDQETDQWFDLSNSSKTLACRTYDIYTFDPQTDETRQITNLPDTHEYNPRWSPDGKKIVHDTWNTDWSSHGIYITDVKTGVSTPLAGAEGGSYPTWSPNEKWIAFDRGADNDYRLFIVPPTGGDPKLVREDAFMASWAPNSQRLAFHQPSDGSIRTIELKGGNETMVAERGNGPAWSPDGEWIAFEMDGDIWKVNVDSHGNPLSDAIQLTSGPVWEGRPTWSNNSKTIAFHAGMGQDTDIWTIPASGGTATWLTGAPVFGDYDANYSFNGQYIAYSSFSPDGQAARVWGAAFSYDVGTWAEGEHSYYLEETHSVPEPATNTTPEIVFNVSNDAPAYNGYVLLRGFALRARVGSGCPAINPRIRPDQNTRFGYGWMTDFPMTYAEAVAHFNSMTVKANWDDGMSADLLRHEIFSWSSVDWDQYVCSATEAPPEPVLYIHYEYPDVVEGDYELGHTVQVTVFDSVGNTKATATVETMEMPHWGGAPGFRVEQWDGIEGPPDIQPGDVVRAVVDGGLVTTEVRIGEIAGTIDLDTNSITGTINAPWAGDFVNVMCSPWGAPGGASDKETTVAPDGVNEFTCTWDSTEWDIQPGETVGVSYWGNDMHSVANAISNPWIVAFPEFNNLFGYGWPVGSEVSLTIDNEYIATVNVEGAPWDPNDIMAFFDFNGVFDLVTGNVVMLSGSEMERTHIVQNLAVTEVNMETDTVSGIADSGATVHAWVHGFGHDVQIDATDGTWDAYFGLDEFHLQPGMCGRAEIRVEGNNSTNVDWCIPNPVFTAFPEQDYIEGWNWSLGDNIHMTIDDPASDLNPDFEKDQPVDVTPWDPNGAWVTFNFAGEYNMKPGDVVTLSDGVTTRTLTIQNLALTRVEIQQDSVSGTADVGAVVHAWVHGYGRSEMVLTVEDGTWMARFWDVEFDLVEGMCGRSEIRNEEGNSTAVDWCYPVPHFTVFPEQDYIEGWEWLQTVYMHVDDPALPGQWDFYTQATPEPTPWDPNSLWVRFDLKGQFDLKVGDVVYLDDDSVQRDMTVRNLSITEVNDLEDTVSGTADPGAVVHVWPHETGEQVEVKADTAGNWQVDFTGMSDLIPGACGRSEIRDGQDNGTAVDWCVPWTPRIVVQITDDWFRAENFTPNAELTFWVYEAEGGPLLRHPENTWQLDDSGYVTVGMWELAEYIDLVPGNYLVVSDGTITRELVLEAFTFNVFDLTNGHLEGTAPEPFGRTVWVGIGLENDAWIMEVTTDLNGNWNADFGAPVPSDYQWVAAQIFDADGDASEVRPASQIIFLRPRCGITYTAQAGSQLEIRYGSWLALGEDLAEQNAQHLTVNLVLDGEPVTGVQQPVVPGSEIPCGASDDAYGVFYVTQVGPLSAGTHVASVTWIFDEQVTDGGDADGDGVPDLYGPGEVFTQEFTIIVQ